VIERIPAPVVREVKPPVTTELAPPVVDIPGYNNPSYEPPDYSEDDMVIEENIPQPPPEKPDKAGETPADARDIPDPPAPPAPPKEEQAVIEVPFIDYELPVPKSEQVALAGTTAFASVGATLLGKALVEQLVKLLKPVVKQLLLRIRALLNRDRTQWAQQELLALDVEKKIRKRLEKEEKESRLKQRAAAGAPLHQRILRGRGSSDEK
jgi:hypothetical protein